MLAGWTTSTRSASGGWLRSGPKGRGVLRAGLAMLVVATVILLVAACAPTGAGSYQSPDYDPTASLGGVVWIVDGEVLGLGSGPHGSQTLEVRVNDVLWRRDYYFLWGERFDTPVVESGSTIRVTVFERSTKADLAGRMFLGLDADGTPEEFAAGVDADGLSPYGLRVAFDPDWNLVEAPHGAFDAVSEVLDLYPGQGLERVVALVDDAWVGLEAENEAAMAEMAAADPAKAPRFVPPATPGPLGQWRRAHGYEVDEAQREVDEARQAGGELAAWLAQDPVRRQLPTIPEDFPPGAEDALGVGRFVERRGVVVVDDAFLKVYVAVGVRVPGIGVLGPFFVDPSGIGDASGLMPPGRTVEIVAWTQDEVSDLADAEVLATVTPRAWKPGSDLWVEAVDDGHGGFAVTVTAMGSDEWDRKLMEAIDERG